MANDDRVLSQAEIDALLKKSPPKPSTPVATTVAMGPRPVHVVPPSAVAVESAADVGKPAPSPILAASNDAALEQINGLKTQIMELTEQINHLMEVEDVVKQIQEKVKTLEAGPKSSSPDEINMMKGQLNQVSSALEVFQKTAKSGDNFLDGFYCDHCHSQGLVAVHVKCTTCGKENWMGYWLEDYKK
jgi:hypothetical protein